MKVRQKYIHITVTDENYRHILRHFSAVSVGARKKLCEIGIFDENISVAFQSLGGKFQEKISDPFLFVDALREVIDLEVVRWVVDESLGLERCDLLFNGSVLKKAFSLSTDEVVGYHNVVKITSGMEVHQEERGLSTEDRVIVNIVTNCKPILTDAFAVVLVRRDGVISLATTYPCGDESGVSPELPNPQKQSPEEFKKSAEWWSHYAFIKYTPSV